MIIETQRHRDTEGFKGPFGPKNFRFCLSLCLCVSVVNRRAAAAAQRVMRLLVGLAVLPGRQLAP